MTKKTSRARQLSDRILRLKGNLPSLVVAGNSSPRSMAENRATADFRTRRSTSRGIERDVPGVFTLDDDPTRWNLVDWVRASHAIRPGPFSMAS